MKIFVSLIGIALLSGIILFIYKGHISKSMANNIGIENGQLKACSEKPNCVCSFTADKDSQWYIDPINTELDTSQIKTRLESLGLKIISIDANYIHATHTSLLFRFVDDVEVLLIEKVAHIRSASRVGHSDLGANRKRVELIRSKL
jgi:uncharacterized protein (DUF1499 family)